MKRFTDLNEWRATAEKLGFKTFPVTRAKRNVFWQAHVNGRLVGCFNTATGSAGAHPEWTASGHLDDEPFIDAAVDFAEKTAKKHAINTVYSNSNSVMCLAECAAAKVRGDRDAALMWAAKSLAYAVGVFHDDYQAVNYLRNPNAQAHR